MNKTRLEAFSDGVLAIVITLMALELHIPHGQDLSALWPVLPTFLSYVLSYIYIGIYWNNHHHLLHAARHATGGALWANLHLLFWLSLFPFVTGWMGQNLNAPVPTACYGTVLFMAGTAYWILTQSLLRSEGRNSLLAKAVGRDLKGKLSVLVYALAIPSALFSCWIAQSLYTAVALVWLVPDRRIERLLSPSAE
jgi:uncharacterized membrane protein